jgi:3-methylcrotonyl-CoA carboxylase alpha subunit
VGDGSDLQKVSIECLDSASIKCAMGSARHVFVRSAGGLLTTNGHSYYASKDHAGLGLWCDGDYRRWTVLPEVEVSSSTLAGPGSGDAVVADLPGVLTQILVEPGQAVTAGTPVAVVEAMKLFHTLVAPRDGVVASTPIACGVTVNKGAVLVALEPSTVATTAA